MVALRYLLAVAGEAAFLDFAVLVATRGKRGPVRMKMRDVADALHVSLRTAHTYRNLCVKHGYVAVADDGVWITGPAWRAMAATRPKRVRVPAEIAALAVSRGAKRILAKLAEDQTEDFIDSAASLARRLNLHTRTAKKLIAELTKSGLLEEVERVQRRINGRVCQLVRRRVVLPTCKTATPGSAELPPLGCKTATPYERAKRPPPVQVPVDLPVPAHPSRSAQRVRVGGKVHATHQQSPAPGTVPLRRPAPAEPPEPPPLPERTEELRPGGGDVGDGDGGGGVLFEVPEEGRDLSQPMPPVSVTANGGDVDRIALLAESFSDFRPKTRRYAKTPSAQLAFDVLDAKRVGLEFAGLLLLAELGSELTEATLDDIERDRGVPTAMASASLTAALRAAEDDGFRQRAEHVGVTPDSWKAARECVGAA